MQTKNLIQASANVIKLTRLCQGDVVKIVDEGYSDPQIFYGVVIDLLNNGEKSFVQIMRFKKSYSTIDCEIKTYSGDKDFTIFPATVDEIKEHLGECIDRIARDIKDDERKLSDKKLALIRAKEFVSMETSKKLQDASFKEISQSEYMSLKQAQPAEIF